VIGTSLVREFLQTILMTGRIQDEAPVSTFIIAKPEHGKTSICLETPFSCAVDLTDTTGKGLHEILKYKEEITHIILNDLTAMAAHGKTVRAYLIAMINAMTEEGIRSIAFPGQVDVFKNGKRGIVACVTPGLLSDQRIWFNKIGLSSRIIPFHYTYSEALVIKIKLAINNGTKTKEPDALIVPSELVAVSVDAQMSDAIYKISETKYKELGDDTGIRRLKQFRRLAQAHAIFRGGSPWKNVRVTNQDVDFLKRIYPYIDYKRGCIL
jgi:hypothetical protein